MSLAYYHFINAPVIVTSRILNSYLTVGIVTHKGASADGGHYIGWVKKDSIDTVAPGAKVDYDNANDEWYKFDDDKVSVVNKEKILTLDGGGEDSTAYILLYRFVAKSLCYRHFHSILFRGVDLCFGLIPFPAHRSKKLD